MAAFLRWPRSNDEFRTFARHWGLLTPVAIRALALGYYVTFFTGRRLIITSGIRSAKKQRALRSAFRQGQQSIRPAAHSCHEVGRAFDVTYENGDFPDRTVGRIGEQLGLRWGASWGDRVHFDLGGPCA